MGDSLTCPECGAEVDSMDQLEADHEVHEIEEQKDGSFKLYGNRDLFLCKNCKSHLGVSRSKRGESSTHD